MYTLRHIKKRSIARDYILIVGSIILTLIALSLSYAAHINKNNNKILQKEILVASKQISQEMEDSLDYIQYLMNYLGKRIAKDGPENINNIAQLLHSQLVTESKAKKKFSWTIFDWITPDNKMIASTMGGVFQKPKDVSSREYTKLSKETPWTLHFDKANIGIPSGEWIIPIGMGITNYKNQFIGIISTGVSIPHLSYSLEQAIQNKHISFIILDKDANITIHSSDLDPASINPSFFKENKHLLSDKQSTLLEEKITFDKNTYIHQTTLKQYPYTILVGHNKTLASNTFYKTLVPILISISILGIICILLLIILRRLLVDPIIELSDAVDRLTKNKTIGKFKKCKTYETLNLAAQIIKLKRLLAYEKSSRVTLKNTLEIAQKSDLEKEKFLRQLYEEVNKPINAIISKTNQLKETLDSTTNALSPAEQIELLEQIQNTATTIQTFSNNVLDITPIRLRSILENCITIVAKNAHSKKSKLSLFIPMELPLFYGDEVKMQQIIIGLLSRSLEQTSENGEIQITAQLKEGSEHSNLEVTITDNGFGLDEKDITRLKSKIDNVSKNTYGIEGMPIELPVIEKLIELHQGTLTIKNNVSKGTKTIISLPFLSRSELESSSPNTKETETKTDNKDIITFPKRK